MLWLNNRIKTVNDLIEAAVKESGVAEYVDVYNAFNGHEICSNGNDMSKWYMNGLMLYDAKNPSPESFHPNPTGHAAEEAILAGQYFAGLHSGSQQTKFTPVIPGQTVNVPVTVPTGTLDSFTIWASWSSDANLAISLYDEKGRLVTPIDAGAAGSGPTYAHFFIYGKHWTPGQWQLRIANDRQSSPISVMTGFEPIRLRLPPLGAFQATQTCGFGGISGSKVVKSIKVNASASVADISDRDNSNRVQSWTWEFYGPPPLQTANKAKETFKWRALAESPLVEVMLTVEDREGAYGYASRTLSC